MVQFFCSTCAPSFLLPDRDRVNFSFSLRQWRSSCWLMNSEPLSESIPLIGNGRCFTTSLTAAITWTCRLSGTVRFSVHPVAMSVTVRVKQNRPRGVAALVGDQVDLHVARGV